MARLLLIILILINYALAAQGTLGEKEINPADTFPVPQENKDMLFYIQRTHNKNTIVYEVNYNEDSTIKQSDPIKIYWIRYSDKGEVAPLSYIQRKYAYGVESILVDSVKSIFKINFVSYKKREIYVVKSKKEYKACININGKLCYLSKAFVKITGGTFFVPHIAYVELFGFEIGSGKKVTEKIIP